MMINHSGVTSISKPVCIGDFPRGWLEGERQERVLDLV